MLWKLHIFLFFFCFFIYNIFDLYSLRNAAESLSACCSDSYGTPYLCYFQCFWWLEGPFDKHNNTFVVSWYEIYETRCVISVFCSPKARKVPKLHNSFHKFYIKWPLCKILYIRRWQFMSGDYIVWNNETMSEQKMDKTRISGTFMENTTRGFVLS